MEPGAKPMTPSADAPLILYATPLSGHAHRVEQLIRLLELPYRLEAAPPEVRATPAFRALNPMGQIPVLVDGDVVLTDSNAIMVYLVGRYAPDSDWLPAEPLAAAAVQRWLSIASGEVAYGPMRARAISQWNYDGDLGFAQRVAQRLLAFMDQHLAERDFLAATHPTLADLACCDYVAHAPEGGVSLEEFPNIRAWIERVEAIPGYRRLPDLPIPSA